MKLAILADIHGNVPALETATSHLDQWRPDAVVVAGDVVNRGPRSLECLRFVQQREQRAGWLTILGNHEEYVIAHSRPDAPRVGPLAEVFHSSLWTYRQLGCDVSALEDFPFQRSLAAPDGGEVRVVHASTRGTRDGIFPQTPDDVLRKQIGRPVPRLICVGHTHVPLIRQLGETLVVNAGAVGMPFDGDHRVSYARLTWHQGRWQAQIVRLNYDRAQAERDFEETGFLQEGGPLALLMLRELRLARSQLYQWAITYEEAVLAGEISLADSVAHFIEQN